MTNHPHVFVAWQAPESRAIMPVGRLLAIDNGKYEFSYIHAAKLAKEKNFAPFVAFPDFDTVYRSEWLPALFSNRVMPSSRPDYPSFISQLGLAADALPLETLARSGGRRMTDTLEVFAPPSLNSASKPEMRILVRGVRHVPGAEDAINELAVGDQLFVLLDRQNEKARYALLLRTESNRLVGYLPEYLAAELGKSDPNAGTHIRVTVEKVNPAPAPIHHRLLCRVELPPGRPLFLGDQYAPIPKRAVSVEVSAA